MNAYLRKKTTMKDKRELFRRLVVSRTSRVALVCVMCVSGFLCIWQVNNASSKGFVITQYERQVSALERETRNLEVEIAEHTSMRRIREQVETMQFERVTDPQFVSISGNTVARQ